MLNSIKIGTHTLAKKGESNFYQDKLTQENCTTEEIHEVQTYTTQI